MPNIEIKARCADLQKAREIASRLQARPVGVIQQIDTYFNTSKGRMKLREISGEGAWLIPYFKTYEKHPTKSDYQLLEVKDPVAVKQLLSTLLGTRLVVDKTREILLVDHMRVHLDQVKDLGTFIELEAVFDVDTSEAREREVRNISALVQAFGIAEADLLTRGYVDLVEERSQGARWI